MVLYQFCGLTGTLASAGIVSLSISVCIVHTLCLFELLKVLCLCIYCVNFQQDFDKGFQSFGLIIISGGLIYGTIHMLVKSPYTLYNEVKAWVPSAIMALWRLSPEGGRHNGYGTRKPML